MEDMFRPVTVLIQTFRQNIGLKTYKQISKMTSIMNLARSRTFTMT